MTTCTFTSDTFDPYVNLAREQRLLDAPVADIVLFLWRNDKTVIIGAHQNPWSEVNLDALHAMGGHLARRRTGGGAVYHDIGNLNFSFVTRACDYDVPRQLSVIARALVPFGIHAEVSGRNDLLTEGRKFSGNAFLKTKDRCLHHGTLLITADMPSVARVLTPDPLKLAKKGVASVSSRVVNLSTLAPQLTVDALIPVLCNAFHAEYGTATPCAFPTPLPATATGSAAWYASDTWLYAAWRDTPPCAYKALFTWGLVEARVAWHANGQLARLTLATDALDADAIPLLERRFIGCSRDASFNDLSPHEADIWALITQTH